MVYHVDREVRTYPVEYLALCDDGRLLGLRLSLDGFYEVCDQSEGFMGLCNPDENGFYKFCAHKYKE